MEYNYKTVSALLFPEQTTEIKTPSQKFDEQFRSQLQAMRSQRLGIYQQEIESIEDENFKEIANFIKNHVLSVGKEQSVKDFQCGLNFLHKDLIEPLKEDGEFGEKTFRAFYDIFKHYDIAIIKNAIRKGALSNAVIGTSSNKEVNTKALVNQLESNLGGIR